MIQITELRKFRAFRLLNPHFLSPIKWLQTEMRQCYFENYMWAGSGIKMDKFVPHLHLWKSKMPSASGVLRRPLTSWPGLCLWTVPGAPPPDSDICSCSAVTIWAPTFSRKFTPMPPTGLQSHLWDLCETADICADIYRARQGCLSVHDIAARLPRQRRAVKHDRMTSYTEPEVHNVL